MNRTRRAWFELAPACFLSRRALHLRRKKLMGQFSDAIILIRRGVVPLDAPEQHELALLLSRFVTLLSSIFSKAIIGMAYNGTSAGGLVYGWVPSPNTRGTIDILSTSLATIYLCTWTCLCLNIPRPTTKSWRTLFFKIRWQIFTILFPEVLVAIAAEQWLSAKQSVREFAELGFSQWTIRHGFYADMGGFLVAPPDDVPFVIDSQQLAYLVRKKYLQLPDLNYHTLRIANKANGFSRCLTFVQMMFFCTTCAGRGIKHLDISPIEVTTLAFILCTLHTYFFWYHKPMDPDHQIVLELSVPLYSICPHLKERHTYKRTPLDFVKPPPDSKSLIAPFWFGFRIFFGEGEEAGPKPLKAFSTSRPNPAFGVSLGVMCYTILLQVFYFGFQIGLGWNMVFPSVADWYLWMFGNFTEAGLIAIYFLCIPLGTRYAPFIGSKIFRREANSILEVAAMLPQWAKILLHGPFVFAYIAARLLVLAESLITLRAMPAILYQDLRWTNGI